MSERKQRILSALNARRRIVRKAAKERREEAARIRKELQAKEGSSSSK